MKRLILLLFFITSISVFADTLETYRLSNGLQVVLYEKKGLPLVNVNVVYKTGCKDEYNGITGIAHMLEHMNFRGSKNFKDGFFEKFVTENGGIENASTSFDMTRYYVTVKKEALPMVLKIYSDNTENLLIKRKSFLKERNVVYQERLWRTDNSPDGYLYYTLQKLAYSESPYRWTPIGFASDILHWSRDDVYDFYRRFYAPSNAVLVICGDIDISNVKKLVSDTFGKLKKRKVKSYFTEEPKQKGMIKSRINFVSSNKKLAMAYHIPPLSKSSTPILDIVTYYLFARDNALLKRELVREKKIVSSIYGGNQERLHKGLFVIFATLNKDAEFDSIEKFIFNEIENIKKGNINKKEFEYSKKRAVFDYYYSKETYTSLGSSLSYYAGLNNIDYFQEYPNLIKNVTVKDMQKIVRKYFKKSNLTVVELMPVKGKNIKYVPPVSGEIR